MHNPTSTEYTTALQMKGLLRLGDVVIPGTPASTAPNGTPRPALPSFSEAGVAIGIDRMLPYMYDDDRAAFLALATASAVLPKPAIKLIVSMASSNKKFPEPLAALMRMANLGIKGVIHSLYYSDVAKKLYGNQTSIHHLIGYETKIDQDAFLAAKGAAAKKDPQ